MLFPKFEGLFNLIKPDPMNQFLRMFVLGSIMLSAALVQAERSPLPALERICNSRFGFCIEYPGALLTQKHISENNDGVALLSADGDIQLRVYGYFNVMGWSVNEEYQDFMEVTRSNNGAVKELEVNFKDDQFDALLQVGERLHYERTVLKGNHFISMTLEVNRRGAHSFEDSRVQLKQLLDEIILSLN